MDDELRAAIDRAIAELLALSDPCERFERAGRLVTGLRDVSRRVAQHRAESARDIYDAERVSLAALAETLGVTKARAAQLVDRARGKGSTRKSARGRSCGPEALRACSTS